MGEQEHRRFEDARGSTWEVHPQEAFKWQFVPVGDDERVRKIATPPPAATDPSDLTEQELQQLLDSGIPTRDITEPLEPDSG